MPGATAIFRKLKLDYCCGGAISLGAAAKKRGLELADVERQLAALTPQETEIPETSEEIIDYLSLAITKPIGASFPNSFNWRGASSASTSAIPRRRQGWRIS